MKKKKIALFTGYFLPHLGGVERYVDKLSGALKKRGYEIVIVTSSHDDSPNYEKHEAYTIYRLPILNIAKERYPIPKLNAEYYDLKRRIALEKIDYFIVNTRFHLTSHIGARMGRRARRPVLLIEHGTDHFTVGNKLLDSLGVLYEHYLTASIKRRVDAFYGVSQACNDWLGHFRIQASDVFYNAIDKKDALLAGNEYHKRYPKNEIIITYAGRLIKEKGILNLIDAFQKFSVGQANVRLVIAGDGELLPVIKRDYHADNIEVLGRLDFQAIKALYKRTDIFVCPSLYPEGLPTSILEAALLECAIIATPQGGTKEVIVDQAHGTIVDGSVEALRRALSALTSDPDLRKAQGKKVRARVVKHFEWDSVAAIVDKEIESLQT